MPSLLLQIVAFALLAVVAADKLTGHEVVPIVRQASEVNPDGSYSWSYETANGITGDEQGHQKQIDAETNAQVRIARQMSPVANVIGRPVSQGSIDAKEIL